MSFELLLGIRELSPGSLFSFFFFGSNVSLLARNKPWIKDSIVLSSFKENHFSLHGLCFHGKFCVELTT